MQTNTAIAEQLGLTAEEFETIKKELSRTPNFTELSVFSVMWSEHCCYKNSIVWLKTLPRKGDKLLVEAGEENAGLVDIGDGYACVFKIESHNHPSAIEPFQGAATGVGGIHRDIFTMGARPIAALNSLRFGNIKDKKTEHLLKGVVEGIGFYGNCFGVPTVGGEVYFEDCYNTNPLVNAMSVGVVKVGETVSAIAEGEGNPVFIVGSDTGKDGIHGASFASANITDESTEKLPSVQVGDPFQEKKLLEACLEIIQTGALIGMQDMGAAGISCSTAEMSAKGNAGMIINLDKVPTRQENMQPFEMLLSESQERMLIVLKKGQEQEVLDIFEKWDLHCSQIGEVTNDQFLKFYKDDKLEVELPAELLVLGGGAPQYKRDDTEPKYFEKIKAFDPDKIPVPGDIKAIAEQLINQPNIASKRWIYNQYDSMVGTVNTSTNEPSDAALVLVKETGKVLAITTDCNGRYVFADPFKGGQIAVAEAARNIVCSGAKPLAITNCLNFGNPYDPEVYYQFVQAVKGMGAACEKFNTPVTGGNVSFYNQNPKGAVYPTPVIGMVGLLESTDKRMTLDFKKESDLIYLLGESINDIGSSEYLHKICGIEHSPAPYFNLEQEVNLQQLILKLIDKKLISSAHDISDGGLFTCLLESVMPGNFGFEVNAHPYLRADAYWFGEAQSRVVVSVKPEQQADFEAAVKNFPCEKIGTVKGKIIIVDGKDWGNIQQWKDRYDQVIENYMEKEITVQPMD